MAVRDDFTAGEVLAAADLNDTFASKPPFAYGTATPSTTVEGFIWYDENDTPPTAKFWDGSAFENIAAPSGLSIVTPTSIANSGGTATASGGAVTFTGVSSISLNGVFTSAYENYCLIISVDSSTTNSTNVNIRMRASGTDNSSTNYRYGQWDVDSTGGSGVTTSNSATGFLVATSTNGLGPGINFDVFSPERSVATRFLNHAYFSGDITRGLRIGSGDMTVTTSYDGFTFFISGGNMTGTIRVYGYQNS
jgi:hypothetical protein